MVDIELTDDDRRRIYEERRADVKKQEFELEDGTRVARADLARAEAAERAADRK